VCAKTSEEKKIVCLQKKKKKALQLVAHFLAYLQKTCFLSQFYKQINSSHVLGYKPCAALQMGLEKLMTMLESFVILLAWQTLRKKRNLQIA
jgi:hypothetical protein